MRRVLASVLCAIAFSAGAAPADVLLSPVSVTYTVGKWLLKDRVEVFYVQVEAGGRNEVDATEQAFKLAVNQAVGSLLLSQSEVQNRNVVRQEIINYSSGYVHDFKVVNKEPTANGVKVVVDVWVRRSQLAERLLNESKSTGKVEGGKIAEQIKSVQHQRTTGDRVLQTVLYDYPQRAFDLESGLTRVELNQQRQPILVVPLRVSWNTKYIQSLGEAVKNINQRNDCDSWYTQCRAYSTIKVAGRNGYFDDAEAYNIVHKEMLISQPKVKLAVLDSNGNTAFNQCFTLKELDQSAWTPWRFVDVGNLDVVVNAGRVKDFGIRVNLANVPVGNLDRVEVTVVRKSQCTSFGVES